MFKVVHQFKRGKYNSRKFKSRVIAWRFFADTVASGVTSAKMYDPTGTLLEEYDDRMSYPENLEIQAKA